MRRLAPALCAAVVAFIAALLWWPRGTGVVAPPADDPRLTYATPYRNVNPDVQYVGDTACALCHATHAETYRDHPMGRSFARVEAVSETPKAAPFEHFGLTFSVRTQNGQLVHRQEKLDAEGKSICASEETIRYVIGSGQHGRSYLANHDGFLVQSVISWYTQAGAWDLSPGTDREYLFGRPISGKCLFCHCNHADAVPGTLNRFREPIFTGGAIGCERCHGPGELHVREREAGEVVDGIDTSIVNPRRLEPTLRDAVCQQCHLQGVQRVVRRGRELYDFRPGLPLHLFWSVFVKPEELSEDQKAVGQVEQMQSSRCYEASAGKMGCIACHDPHIAPSAEQKTAFYRGRCLQCHGEGSCKLPLATRREHDAADSCVACHMPRFTTSDIAHTAVTDHRIRRPGKGRQRPVRRLIQGSLPIVHFHREVADPRDPEMGRDMGVALVGMARQYRSAQQRLCQLALPLLNEAVERAPSDLPARADQAYALCYTNEMDAARSAFEAVLARAPNYELTLSDAALLAAGLGNTDEALNYWQRLIKLNPDYPRYRFLRAELLNADRQWDAALADCRAVLRANAADLATRKLLVTIHWRRGDAAAARREFDMLLSLGPPNADELRPWFADLTRKVNLDRKP